jgi:integrase
VWRHVAVRKRTLRTDRLGHTNAGFTLQVYTHVYDEQRKQAAVSFQELLNKEVEGQG